MTIDEVLSDLEDKVFCRSVTLQELTKMEQVYRTPQQLFTES